MKFSTLAIDFRLSLIAAASAASMAWTTLPALGAEPAASSTAPAEYKVIAWEALVPKDWDPIKRFRDMNVGGLSDSNPKVQQMMREMREAWDAAPTNNDMDGAAVRLPGYIVPLDEVKGELKEFLLVPYFGACIHTPPPPANQIIHVLLDKPLKGFRMMDPVWINGRLKTQRVDSAMGASGYQMQAVAVDRYVAPARQ